MIVCVVCRNPLRQRVLGEWVHVDLQGHALAEEMVWPRDHAPKAMRVVSENRVAFDVEDVQVRWGDGLAFDRAEWMRMWAARR